MSTNTNDKNITVKGLELKIDMLVDGIAKLVPPTLTVIFDGKTYTQPELLKEAQTLQASFKGRRNLRTQLAQQQNEVVHTTTPAAEKFVSAGRILAHGLLGATNPEIATFGFKPRKKPAPLTAEQKAASAEKARLTREARHTMGPRQKQAIHGDPAATTPSPPAGDASVASPSAATPGINKKVV